MDIDHNWNVLAQVVVLALELAAGLFFNVFIVFILLYDFYSQKNMGNSNKILVCLSISNVIYNIVISAGLLDHFIGRQPSFTSYLSSMYIIFLLYSVSSCAWLTAGLGVFYFIKISQVRLLSWVKLHISSIVPWMLLVLEVVSFIFSFFSSFLLIRPLTSLGNITDSPHSVLQVLAENRSGLISAVLAVTSLPLLIAVIFTVCTVWTLKQHSQKMEGSMKTADNERLMTFLGVVCRMTHFLLFYVIFETLMLILYFAVIAQIGSGFWVTLLLMSSFTPVQSVLVILGNPKLKDAFKETLDCLTFTRLLCGSKDNCE